MSDEKKDDTTVAELTKEVAAVSVEGKAEESEYNDMVDYEIVVDSKAVGELLAAESFEDMNLPADILRALKEDFRFNRPSKIQAQAVPMLLKDPPTNMIAQAQNGSGKTITFLIAMMVRVDRSVPTPQAMCICHTRELARQTYDVACKLATHAGISVRLVIPGQEDTRGQVIIGTSGTLKYLLQKRELDARAVKVLVLDEADELIADSKKKDDPKMIKTKIQAAARPTVVQLLLISATLDPHVEKFARQFAPNANTLLVKKEDLALTTVKQFVVGVPQAHVDGGEDAETHPNTLMNKVEILHKFLKLYTSGQVVIFLNRRHSVEWLHNELQRRGLPTSKITGTMEKADRDRVFDRFRSQRTRILLATDVLARGIDVVAVQLVINFDVPRRKGGTRPNPETYLHRVGRTGRFGKIGVAITLIQGRESQACMQGIADLFKLSLEVVPLGGLDEDGIDEKIEEVVDQVKVFMRQKAPTLVPAKAPEAAK